MEYAHRQLLDQNPSTCPGSNSNRRGQAAAHDSDAAKFGRIMNNLRKLTKVRLTNGKSQAAPVKPLRPKIASASKPAYLTPRNAPVPRLRFVERLLDRAPNKSDLKTALARNYAEDHVHRD